VTALRAGGSERRSRPPPLPAHGEHPASASSRRATFVAGPSEVAKRFGSLEVIGRLASGGMATVYLCRLAGKAGFQRLFAVKALHLHLAADESFVSMLMDEARIAARLHHPHAVGINDIGVQDGAHYLVMDYVEGCSLSEMLRLQSDGAALGLFVRVIVDALNGLDAAHTLVDDHEQPLALIHRDVSPQNILIGTDGSGWITDFGIAKAKARITSTQPGVFKGKISYLAPELLLPPHHYDHRVDIFAAGAVLWSVLTGQKLFQADTDAKTAHNILHMDVPPPSTVGWRPPECFDQVCLRALEREAAKRHHSAAELASELRNVALEAGLLASPFEVASWVKTSFKAELEARHEAIRRFSERGTSRPPFESIPLIPPMSRAENTPPTVTPSAIELLEDSAPMDDALVVTPLSVDDEAERPPPARRWVRAAVAMLLLVLAILVPVVVFSRARATAGSNAQAAAAPPASVDRRADSPVHAPPAARTAELAAGAPSAVPSVPAARSAQARGADAKPSRTSEATPVVQRDPSPAVVPVVPDAAPSPAKAPAHTAPEQKVIEKNPYVR